MAHYRGVVRVENPRNPPKVLNRFAIRAQECVELLSVGMPLLLRLREMRREVHKHPKDLGGGIRLSEYASDRVPAPIRAQFISSAGGRQPSQPGGRCLYRRCLIRHLQQVALFQSALKRLNRR